MTEQKGIHWVVPFVHRVLSSGKYPKAMFVMAGEGDKDQMAQLRDLVYTYPGRVGYPSDAVSDQHQIYYDLYTVGDIFLAFSGWEPGGISPMEALAYLTICLVSDKQGHKSTVRSVFIRELARELGIYEDQEKPNGARFPIDDMNIDQTVEYAMKAYDALYNIWENDKPRWERMMVDAFFSDNSWKRVSKLLKEMFGVINHNRTKRSLFPGRVVDDMPPSTDDEKAEALDRINAFLPEAQKLMGPEGAAVDLTNVNIKEAEGNILAAWENRPRAISINFKAALRAPPQELLIRLVHELFHARYPRAGEKKIDRLTLDFIIRNQFLDAHLAYATSNPDGVIYDAAWIERLKSAIDQPLRRAALTDYVEEVFTELIDLSVLMSQRKSLDEAQREKAPVGIERLIVRWRAMLKHYGPMENINSLVLKAIDFVERRNEPVAIICLKGVTSRLALRRLAVLKEELISVHGHKRTVRNNTKIY